MLIDKVELNQRVNRNDDISCSIQIENQSIYITAQLYLWCYSYCVYFFLKFRFKLKFE